MFLPFLFNDAIKVLLAGFIVMAERFDVLVQGMLNDSCHSDISYSTMYQ